MFKVGDKVRDVDVGLGTVVTIHSPLSSVYPVRAEFKDGTYSYTLDGRFTVLGDVELWKVEEAQVVEADPRDAKIAELEARVAELEENAKDPEEMIKARLLFANGYSRPMEVSRRAKRTNLKQVPFAPFFAVDTEGRVSTRGVLYKTFNFTGMDGEVAVFSEVTNETK